MKIVNLETIIDMQSWCRTWPPNGSKRIRAKTKLHKKPREACKSFWSRIGTPKVIYTDNSLEFGKACEELSWNFVHQRLTVAKQMVLLEEQYAESSKDFLQCCGNLAWMKSGGLIRRNTAVVCETFKGLFSDRVGQQFLSDR